MVETGKLAVIGNKNIVNAFKALGIEVFPYTNINKVKETIKKLTDDKYAIIMLTQDIAQDIDDFMSTFNAGAYPIILPIPCGKELTNYSQNKIQQTISKAIGSTQREKK